MSPEQRAAIAAGQRRAWTDPDIRARRIEALRKAWDDPLRRAAARAAREVAGSKRSSPEAYRAYYRAYRRWKTLPVDAMKISRRAKRALWFGGYKTAGELDRVGDDKLLAILEFGRTSLDQVRMAIEQLKRDAETRHAKSDHKGGSAKGGETDGPRHDASGG